MTDTLSAIPDGEVTSAGHTQGRAKPPVRWTPPGSQDGDDAKKDAGKGGRFDAKPA